MQRAAAPGETIVCWVLYQNDLCCLTRELASPKEGKKSVKLNSSCRSAAVLSSALQQVLMLRRCIETEFVQ